MDKMYYDTVKKLEQAGASVEYINGWMSGYLKNPMREEQRITDGYSAGYADGENKKTDSMNEWLGK